MKLKMTANNKTKHPRTQVKRKLFKLKQSKALKMQEKALKNKFNKKK